MWFFYIVRCADDSLYIGETKNIAKRLEDHNRGRGGPHTFKRRPVALAYAEEHPARADCLARERQVKGWTRAKKEALIAGNMSALEKL